MLKPLRGYVLIEPIKDTDKTPTGVYLPESAKDKPMKGRLLGIGAPTTADSLPNLFEEGNIVYYKKWGNEEVKEDGKEYVFVRFEDLLGVSE